jgi:hypothetical protein
MRALSLVLAAPLAVLGSTCPTTTDRTQPLSYGGPACVVDRVTQGPVALGGGCFPRALPRAADGQVACTVLEARAASPCTCDPARARTPLPEEDRCYADATRAAPFPPDGGWTCICAIAQAQGAASASCREDLQPSDDGWCYVEPLTSPSDDPALVAACPANEQRVLRFVGAAVPEPGATVFVACQ